MKNSTGLDRVVFQELIDIITDSPADVKIPPILGILLALKATLKYLRRNRTQAGIADDYGVSQPTISRAITALTPAIAAALEHLVPTADDVPPGDTYLIDGTLLPCWSWADRPDLHSGKHHTTGVNVQVASDLQGTILWVSDPLPGRTHDVTALDAHGILHGHDPSQFIGDKGYIGRGMTTPIRKPQNQPLFERDKEYNTQVNQLRYKIERAIANLKTWRILHTDYRRPIKTLPTTITAVLGLYFLKAA